MRLSLRALKFYVDTDLPAEKIADVFADLGFPNDGFRDTGAPLRVVVVGRIEEMKPHPQADRLSLLKVKTDSLLSIVCGAKNMKVGDLVALAPVGVTIPGKDGKGMTLQRTKIRGELSEGMCCSEVELGLGEEADGIWILNPKKITGGEAALGKSVAQFYPELDDVIFEIDVTPNRGDAMSTRGLAREFAAKQGTKIKPPPLHRWKTPSDAAMPSIESFSDCFGFAACYVAGVTQKETTQTWKHFLSACGARSLGNLVDITNIVLFELGHPIHFFDADKVDPKTICARRARPGEKLKLLNDQTIELSPEDIVIADKNGVLSLAGVMGGAESAVSSSTKNILIEVASFHATRIRATARRHGISSESSLRFERGVTPYRLEETLERALHLLNELSGFDTASGSKVVDRALVRPSCLWDRVKVEKKLGKLEKSDNDIFDLLRRLEYEFEPKGSTPKMIFPWYRSDCELLEDAMEDVARLLGYEALEKRPVSFQETAGLSSDLKSETEIGEMLIDRAVSRGVSEVLHLSFTSPELENAFFDKASKSVVLKNPIHAEKSVLRRSLIPQLVDRAKFNAHHSEEGIWLAEIGPVFSQDGVSDYSESPFPEVWKFGLVYATRPTDEKHLWEQKMDAFFRFKGLVLDLFEGLSSKNSETVPDYLHPTRQFVVVGGVAGELHPQVLEKLDFSSRVFAFETSLKLKKSAVKYLNPPAFPAIDLDASFSVSKEISAAKLTEILLKNKGAHLENLRLYDVYEAKEVGSEKRALTFAMRYRSLEGTLELETVKAEHSAATQNAIKFFGSDKIALR